MTNRGEWKRRRRSRTAVGLALTVFLILAGKAGGAGSLSIQKTGTELAPVFRVSHPFPAPVEAEFQLIRGAEATVSEPPMPVRIVIPPGRAVEAFRLRPRRPGGAWSYRYSHRFVPGDPRARHAPERPYRPPVPAGRRFRLAGTGQGDEAHAVTILMPAGTVVASARAGRVVAVGARPFRRRIGQRVMEGQTTFVRLLHADGTFGLYAHLDRNSVRLQLGGTVRRGQPLGRIGRKIDPPALLFMVQRNAGMKLVSVPFQFEGPNGGGVRPTRGMILTSR